MQGKVTHPTLPPMGPRARGPPRPGPPGQPLLRPPGTQWQSLLPYDAGPSWVARLPTALHLPVASRLFEDACAFEGWERPYARGRLMPRSTFWATKAPCCCNYNSGGCTLKPGQWTAWLEQAARLFLPLCGVADHAWPDAVRVNKYQGGTQNVAWHSDDEAILGHAAEPKTIVGLPLGHSRRVELRANGSRAVATTVRDHGDILVMGGLAQHHYQHLVPSQASAAGTRISITRRWIRAHDAECPAAALQQHQGQQQQAQPPSQPQQRAPQQQPWRDQPQEQQKHQPHQRPFQQEQQRPQSAAESPDEQVGQQRTPRALRQQHPEPQVQEQPDRQAHQCPQQPTAPPDAPLAQELERPQPGRKHELPEPPQHQQQQQQQRQAKRTAAA